MNAAEFIAKLKGVTCNGDGWSAKCPGHEDHRASLSVKTGNDGKILVHCHAGCDVGKICDALGMKVAELFTGKPERNGKLNIVATYDYQDEAGKLLFQVCRTDPKDFRQRRPDGKGGWIWATKNVRHVPFRLPQLITAAKAGRPVFIAEGEKDVLALEKAGFAATTNPGGGTAKWLDSYNTHFEGADVVVIADKDATGRKHAQDVANSLQGTAASVKVIECADLDEKPVKDAADYFAAGGQASELDALAEAAPEWTPEVARPDPWLALVQDGADIASENLPALLEVVEGLVAEHSKLVVVSSAKCFKTWLVIHLALCIAHGVPFLGRKAFRMRVLYCNLELKSLTFKRRVQAIARGLGLTLDPQCFFHLPLRGHMAGQTVHDTVSRIIALARQRQIKVVVLDPVFKLNTEGEENSSRDQTLFFNELDRLTTEAECTVILVDHSTKGNQSEKDPLDVIRGSSAKGGDLDAAMVLRKHDVDLCYRVDLVHRELPPVEAFTIGWRFPMMELRPDLSPDEMKRAKGGPSKKYDPTALCAAIAKTTPEKPISVSAWAQAAGIKRQTLTDYLPGLRAKGWIATTGQGNNARQYLTEKGREIARHAKEAA